MSGFLSKFSTSFNQPSTTSFVDEDIDESNDFIDEVDGYWHSSGGQRHTTINNPSYSFSIDSQSNETQIEIQPFKIQISPHII